ncbi:hypothetical protein ES707_17330 [subsurface metagenome]
MTSKHWTRKIITDLGIFLLLMALEAKATSPLQMKVEIGFEGFYKIGSWTPLKVFLENQGPSLEGTLLIKVARGNPLEQDPTEIIYSIPVFLPSSSRKLYQVNVLLETDVYPLQVSLISGKESLLKKEISIQPFYMDEGFILVVNKTHAGFDFLAQGKIKRVRQVLYTDPNKLPSHWIGYDAIQTLILDDIESLELSSEQEKAIEEWLSIGGRLIITAKGGYGKFKSSLISHLLPLESLQKVYLNSSFSSLQSRYGVFTADFQKVELWDSQWRKGDVLVEEEGIPLLVELKVGSGKILFLALDFLQDPFRDWPGKSYFWLEILEEETNFSMFSRGILDSLIEHSIPWPGRFYLGRREIGFFLLAYLVIIGFFYWWLKKRKLGWKLRIGLSLTVVLSALIFSLFWGMKMRRENTFLGQVSIFYKKEGGSLAKTENYFTLFSPYYQSVELKFDKRVSFVTALSAPSREQEFLKDLVVFLPEGKIRWTSSSDSSAWSFHLFRLETILPFSLITKTTRNKETITVSLQNLNSFPLQDLFFLYGKHSSFLKELPAFNEADLRLNLKERETLPSFSSLYNEEVRSKDPRIELKTKVLDQMWNFAGPLKNIAAKSPVLLAWFEENPQTLVKSYQPLNCASIGLAIIPLSIADSL